MKNRCKDKCLDLPLLEVRKIDVVLFLTLTLLTVSVNLFVQADVKTQDNGSFNRFKRQEGDSLQPNTTSTIEAIDIDCSSEFITSQLTHDLEGSHISNTKINASTCPRANVQASDAWLENLLEAHNILRKLHGSQPLMLNYDLSTISQARAQHLVNINDLEHSSCLWDAQLGENLYYFEHEKSSRLFTPEHKFNNSGLMDELANGTAAILLWYREGTYYDYERTKATARTREIGDFTQLVWKGTQEMGAAYAMSEKPNLRGSYSFYLVVNYYPGGNMMQEFKENVKPPVCKNLNIADIHLPIFSSPMVTTSSNKSKSSEVHSTKRNVVVAETNAGFILNEIGHISIGTISILCFFMSYLTLC